MNQTNISIIRLVGTWREERRRTEKVLRPHVRVRVIHLKEFFLPVDIQHNQCPCEFFNPKKIPGERYGVEKLRHISTTLLGVQYGQ